jgi:hypothetical protein
MSTLSTSLPGGSWSLGNRTVTRFGYGAMQLAGPGVMGPPADHDRALTEPERLLHRVGDASLLRTED